MKESAYTTDLMYLDEVLALIALRLRREVLIQRRLRGDQRQEAFLGLFLSDDDVDAILDELHGYRLPGDETQVTLDEQIIALRDRIASRVQLTDRPLLPQRLANLFGLNNNEIDLLLYLLAAEVDDRYGRVYGYLHDDVARKRLSPGLAFRLMRDTVGALPSFRRLFSATSPLLFYRLINMGDGHARWTTPLMERPVRLEDRVVEFLLGDHQFDSSLFGYGVMRAPAPGVIESLPGNYLEAAATLAARFTENAGIVVLEGGRGSDADLWATAIAAHTGTPLLELDWRQLARLEKAKRHEVLASAQREARLQSALLYLRRMEAIAEEDFAEFNRTLIGPLCMASAKSRAWRDMGFDVEVIALPDTTLEVRSRLWRHALSGAQRHGLAVPAAQNELSLRLAERYPMPSRELDDVVQGLSAQTLFHEAVWDPEEQIAAVCKRMAGREMAGVAQRIDTGFRFSDLVLPTTTLSLLKEILVIHQHGDKVLHEWALGSLFHQVQGCRALFTGPSGTGKTMAASVLANELGLELYRVDLAQVVSKYIGETEKNLDRVFDAASRARVVLFIDEADALFGKRSEVKDAHDRYANIETSFLLQKMEEYNGVAILASNLSQNMDDAFFRRIDTIVEFPMPQEADRLRLWQRLCDSRAPMEGEVDLALLARNFELSGGHIKNCILTAAFRAAEEACPINMTHLIHAVGREYLKIGKPISKSTFGEFYGGMRKSLAAC